MTRSRKRAATFVALAVMTGVGLEAGVALVAQAASEVPKITNVSTSPSRFCTRNTSGGCANPGTTVRFTISSAATVRGQVWPRFKNICGHPVLKQHFNAGTNTFRLNGNRLTKGRWRLKLQGVNNVGAGTTGITEFIVK